MEHSNRAIEECSMKGPFIAGWAGVRETIKEEYSSIRLAIVGIVLCLFVFWLHWVFVAVRRLSLVVASGGYSSLRCAGFSLWWLLLLWSTGSRHTGFSSCGSRALERRPSSCGARA